MTVDSGQLVTKDGWESKALNKVCQIRPPKKEAKEALEESDLVSFVPMKVLGEHQKYFQPSETKQLSEVSGSYTYFKDKDVLLAKITPCFENGKLGIATNLTNGIGFGSSEYIVYRASEDLKPEFLYYFLSQESFRTIGKSQMTGAVGHKRIPKDFYEQHQIPIPPLAEQKQIVALLDQAFTAIDKAQANIETNINNAKELFQSKLNDIFSQTGEGWEERTLEELISISHGYAFKSKDFMTDFTGNTPIVLTPGNFSEDAKLYFTQKNTKRCISDYPADYLFSQGELVVVMTDLSSKMKILGKPAVIDSDNILHNQRIGRITFNTDELLRDFLCYYFQSSQYLSNIKSTATGTMVRHTAPKRILANFISFPESVKKQESIIYQLSQLKVELEKTQSLYLDKINNLEELKKSILQKAFNGELT